MIDQPCKAVGEDVAGYPELAREFLEVHEAVERRAQDQERPPFAHHFECGGQAAFGRRLQVFAKLGHPGSRTGKRPTTPSGARRFSIANRNWRIYVVNRN